MEIVTTNLPGVLEIHPRVFGDERGFFMETWNQQSFSNAGLDVDFVQDNHSLSSQGTLRGLHYQVKHPQGKLVRVTQGAVFDVAVDMRKDSPTFGQSASCILSAENKKMFWVPPGFAHGFYVLSETAEFQYKCSDIYAPEYDRTLLWNDPELAIDWPLVDGKPPLLSAKDEVGKPFKQADHFG
jgi:dTDP-4-dehydrorhamnose 3,5-epimerase